MRSLQGIFKVKETIDPNYCKLTYIYHSDETAGKLSSLAVNAALVKQASFVYQVKSFFLEHRSVCELDGNDGRELGEALGRSDPDNIRHVIERFKVSYATAS